MSQDLAWSTVTGAKNPKFLTPGAELNRAYLDGYRFQVTEVRTRNDEGLPDRAYVLRDAQTVSDADVKDGTRPRIVGEFDNLADVFKFCRNAQ